MQQRQQGITILSFIKSSNIKKGRTLPSNAKRPINVNFVFIVTINLFYFAIIDTHLDGQHCGY